jgi:hypothetical protein
MRLKGRRQKPEIKLNRRPRKKKDSEKFKTYIFHHVETPECQNCGAYDNDYYEVESRVTLCSKCFNEYFTITGALFAQEDVEGIAEKFHRVWLKAFKEGGGVFSSWDQKLNVVRPEGDY